MSAVKKTAKASLILFSALVFLFIGGAAYIYVNMNSLLAGIIEDVASKALGVDVTVGEVEIMLEEKKVLVSNISIANPEGYKRPDAVKIGSVVIAAETLSSELLVFNRVEVNETNVNLEVRQEGTNLGDIKANAQNNVPLSENASSQENIKVIVRDVYVRKAQLNPSVTLLNKDLAFITVPDIHVEGVGERENGVVAQEAVEQVLVAVLTEFNNAANHAGFLEGLSLDALNGIGVSTVEVFKKNLGKAYERQKGEMEKGVEAIKGLFTAE